MATACRRRGACCGWSALAGLALHLLSASVGQPGVGCCQVGLRARGSSCGRLAFAQSSLRGRRGPGVFSRCHRQLSDVVYDLQEFKSAHGTLAVATDYVTSDGFPLGRWVDDQRSRYASGNISDSSFKLLNDLGFVWDVEAAAWAASFKAFERRRQQAPHFLPAAGSHLHGWLLEQCTLRVEGRLGPVRERRLCDAGFNFLLSSSQEEDQVISFLAQSGFVSGLHYDRRQAIYVEPREIGDTVRSKVFPDFTIHTDWGCVLLEVDEHQHEGLDQEDVQKMQSLIQAAFSAQTTEESSEHQCFARGRRVHIVRYNPHSFNVDTLLGSHSSVSAAELHRRMKLIEAVQYVPRRTVEISYLFFDEVDGWPKVSRRASYPLELRQWVRRVFSLQLPRSVHGAP